VAATFVEGVVNPHMHTIGGEAPMLIYSASARRVVAINGNMMAPARANHRALPLTRPRADPRRRVARSRVPAAFDALVIALGEFGTKSLAEVLEPALELASHGFPMHVGLAGVDASEGNVVAGAGASIRQNAHRFLTKWPSSPQVYLPTAKCRGRAR